MKIYRPVTVVVGLVVVLLGGLVRLGDPQQVLDDVTRQLVRGTIGAPVIGKDFTLTVVRMKVAQTVLKNENDDAKEALTTEGLFVAVEFDIAGRHRPKVVGDLSLTTDNGATYTPIGTPGATSVATPEPGFTESQVAVFEVNPSDLAGLTLRVTPVLFVSYFTVNYAIDLGVPSEEIAAELVSKASSPQSREYVIKTNNRRVTP